MDSVSAGKGNPSGLPAVWVGFWLFVYIIRARNSTTTQREIKSSDKGKKKNHIKAQQNRLVITDWSKALVDLQGCKLRVASAQQLASPIWSLTWMGSVISCSGTQMLCRDFHHQHYMHLREKLLSC